jgi:ligand-binding sensor domain-containing protein
MLEAFFWLIGYRSMIGGVRQLELSQITTLQPNACIRIVMLDRIAIHIVLLTLCFVFVRPSDAQNVFQVSPTTDQYAASIRPMLERYCAECHAPGEMEGVEFLTAATEADVAKHRGVFADVVEQIERHSMPPPGYDQPSEQELKQIADWIKQSLDLKPDEIERIGQYVVEAYQDRKGNLWFGTVYRGIARYDGNRLTYFDQNAGLASNAVPSIAEDKAGVLWIGTQDGVCRFDGKKFVRLGPEVGLPAPSQSSPQATGSVFATRDGELWINIGGRLYRRAGEQLIEFKLPVAKNKINSYAIMSGSVSLKLEDRHGNLWFAVDGGGVYKFDGKTFKHFSKANGLCSNTVTGIIEDQRGRLWFTCMQSFQPQQTGDGGLCRFDGNSFTTFPAVKGLAGNDLYSIYETRSGEIWIGATGVGAYRYDGESFDLFDKTDQPRRTRYFGLQSILEDRDGTLWFGFSGGLFRFDGSKFFHVTPAGPWTR